MRRPSIRPSYANVTSTLALIVATSGGAYAVSALPQDSVGTAQLKTGAVTTPKIASGAVTGAKVKAGSLRLGDFAAGQLFRWKGPWSPTVTYQQMDVVSDAGSTYVARVTSTGASTSDEAAWSLLAAAGAPGQDGADGTNGTDGTNGIDGTDGQDGAPGPSYGDTTTANNIGLAPCGTTDIASLPLHLEQPSRVLGLASGFWSVTNTPPSWYVNQSRWIQVVDGSGSVVAQTLARSSSLTNGGAVTADLGVDNLVVSPTPTVQAGDYTVRLRVLSAADTCPSTYLPKAWEVQFGYVIVGNTP